MRSRIPLAYAGLLIIALVAVIGFAAFSTGLTGNTSTTEATPDVTIATTVPISARVASAVFALGVTPQNEPEVVEQSTTTEANTTTSTETTAATTTSVDAAPPEPETTTTETAGETATATTRASDTTPPNLRVTSPQDGATVDDAFVTFEGTTEPGARVLSNRFEADVDENGDWSLSLVVQAGPNGAVFTAIDSAGNETSVRLVVHLEEEESATTTTAPTPTTTSGSDPDPTTTTTEAPASAWSPLWPADSGGSRNVEQWRSAVAAYWPGDRVDCALGLILRESRGNPAAHNTSTGAVGLFQHLLKYWPARAAGAGFIDGNGLAASPFNAEANIAAAAYLANYYDSRGSNWWQPWYSLPDYGSCGS